MTIEFRKVPKEGFDFSVELDGVTFSGNAVKENSKLLKCSGNIFGTVKHSCDRCGEDMDLVVDEDVEVLVSDGVYEGTEDELLNIIEFVDEKVDFNEIINSEIEAIKSGYFYCKKCQ